MEEFAACSPMLIAAASAGTIATASLRLLFGAATLRLTMDKHRSKAATKLLAAINST
jgi:hypothetical protein